MKALVTKFSQDPGSNKFGSVKPVFVNKEGSWVVASPNDFPNAGLIFAPYGYEAMFDDYEFDELFIVNYEQNVQNFDPSSPSSAKWISKDLRGYSPARNEFCRVYNATRSFDADKPYTKTFQFKPLNDIFLKGNGYMYGPFAFDVINEDNDSTDVELKAGFEDTYIFKFKSSDLEKRQHIHQQGNHLYIKSIDEIIADDQLSREQIYYGSTNELINWAKTIIPSLLPTNEISNIQNLLKGLNISSEFEKARLRKLQTQLGNASDWLTNRLPQFIFQYLETDLGKKLMTEYLDTNASALQAKADSAIELEQLKKELEETKKLKVESTRDKRFEQLPELDRAMIIKLLEDEPSRVKYLQIQNLDKEVQAFEVKRAVSKERLKDSDDDLQKKQAQITALEKSLLDFRKEFSNADDVRTNLLKAKPYVDLINGIVPTNAEQDQQEKKLPHIASLKQKQQLQPILDFLSHIQNSLETTGRKVEYNDLANYIITIHQNFLTVFAGLPGVGKTSLVTKLASAAGMQSRFKSVSTARGWTSAKDLIGYYNPLANEYQAARTGMYGVLQTLQVDQDNRIDVPYWVLLDEANLSPMEYYWSDFMKLCDPESARIVPIIKGRNVENLEIGKGLRFIATVNYDHTTEVFSPRLIDRVPVIRLSSPKELILLDESESNDFPEPEEYFSISQLDNMLNPDTVSSQLKGDLASLFQRIKLVLENEDPAFGTPILISPRKQNAVGRYCATARQVFSLDGDQFIPLDYAVNQFILPLIAGRGKSFSKRLKALQDQVKFLTLTNSTLSRIIKVGEENYDNYRFFV